MSTSESLQFSSKSPRPEEVSRSVGSGAVKSILTSGPMVLAAWLLAIALHVVALTLMYLYVFPINLRSQAETPPSHINLIGDPDGLGLGTNPAAPPGDRTGVFDLAQDPASVSLTDQLPLSMPAPSMEIPVRAIGTGGEPGGRGSMDGPSVVTAPGGSDGPAIGIGSGSGGGTGIGDGTGSGSGGFFGIPGIVPDGGDGRARGARRLVFVVDRSGSMADTFQAVKKELRRSVSSLLRGQRFHVIFFSQGPIVENPPGKCVNAVPAHKEEFFQFLEQVEAGGGTQPELAMRRAFDLEPELIYFLTDGLFDASLLVKLREWNKNERVKISTIAYVSEEGRPLLEQIAREHGGQFRFVSERELP
jgi:hypothetical protein